MKKSLVIMMVASTVLLGITSCNNGSKSPEGNTAQTKTAETMENGVPKISEFPIGDENKGFEQYFTGKSWLAPLTSNKQLDLPMFNVTFEPGCINSWHSHSEGQILIGVGGTGYVQERGKPAVRIEPGVVVEIAPNVEHWHGAAPDSWFSHIAVNPKPETNKNTWLEPVSKEDYAAATKVK